MSHIMQLMQEKQSEEWNINLKKKKFYFHLYWTQKLFELSWIGLVSQGMDTM